MTASFMTGSVILSLIDHSQSNNSAIINPYCTVRITLICNYSNLGVAARVYFSRLQQAAVRREQMVIFAQLQLIIQFTSQFPLFLEILKNQLKKKMHPHCVIPRAAVTGFTTCC